MMKTSRSLIVWSLLLLLPLSALVMIPLIWSARNDMAAGKTDFSDLYTAAYVVKEGQGHLRYDDKAQIEVKSRLFPEDRKTRTHNHLAIEALFLVPFTLFPYPAALTIFVVFDLLIIVASAGLLVAAGLWLRRIPPDLRFSFAIVITTLVSFHLYYHDVSMLIPMFVAAEAALAGRSSQTVLGIAFAVLMFYPLYPFSYLYNQASLMTIPIAMVGVSLAFARAQRLPSAITATATT